MIGCDCVATAGKLIALRVKGIFLHVDRCLQESRIINEKASEEATVCLVSSVTKRAFVFYFRASIW